MWKDPHIKWLQENGLQQKKTPLTGVKGGFTYPLSWRRCAD